MATAKRVKNKVRKANAKVSKSPLKKSAAKTKSYTWPSWLLPVLSLSAFFFAWLGQDQFLAKHLGAGLGCWGLAALCALFAFRQQTDKIRLAVDPSPRLEALVLGLILLIAFCVRLWRLAEIPHGFHFDEAVNALIAQQIILDPQYLPIFGPPDAPLPTLFHYLNVVTFSIGGFTVTAAKWVPVLAGTLTVAVFYFLARRMVSIPVALVAALLLALMRWHLNFSRIHFVGILTPLFGAAAAYFLLRGLETKNRWHMAFSGLSVSLGLYTYFASNLVPFVLGPYMALQLAWDRKFLKEQWRGLLVFLGTAVAVFSPLGYFALTQPERFFFRNNQVLLFHHVPPAEAASAFWSNVKTTLLMFNFFGDCNGRHNLPEAPMLSPLSGILFGLGLVWSLTHLNRRHAFLVFWWWLVALVPGFLTIEAPQGYRCIGAVIPTALLLALGLERLWQFVWGWVRDTGLARYAWLSLAGLGLLIGSQEVFIYFTDQASHIACWSEFNCQEYAMGQRIRALGPKYHTYISAGSYDYPTIRFLGYPCLDSEPFQIIASIPSNYPGEKNLSYMLLPIHDGALDLLKFYYPGGKETSLRSPYFFDLFTAYEVSQSEVEAGRGLRTVFHAADGRTLRLETAKQVFHLKVKDLGLAVPCEAEWQGTLKTPAYGVYEFRLNGAQAVGIWLDGRPAGTAPLLLAEGLHQLSIKARIEKPEEPITFCWRRSLTGTWNMVPGTALSTHAQIFGLSGSYFHNESWSGKPDWQRVDPLLSMLGQDFPLAAPFTARWEGVIHIPKNGKYTFSTVSNEASWVWVNRKLVVRNEKADNEAEGQIKLAAGDCPIRIDYQKKSGAYPRIILSWSEPGGAKQKIPFTALSPR